MIDSIPIKDKSSTEYGIAISEYISKSVYGGLGGYYFDRNARFAKNRAYANGRIDVKAMFADRFDFNGKQNYINIGWQAVQIVNRIISGLVGRWMGRNEKIDIEAKDSVSTKQKQDEFGILEMFITQRDKMIALQHASGQQIMPQNVPSDIDELMLWQSQFQRLPEEIVNEIGVNDVFEENGLFGVIKEKLLHDSAEVGLVCTYTWMDKEGVIHPDYVKPENAIYSYSEYPDFRDTTYRGEAPTMKMSQIRKDYGIEFGGKLTEKDLWEIAATSKNYQVSDNITWLDQWASAYMRPYDEWNVNSLKFELRTVDSEKYTVTTTKGTGSTILDKGLPKTKSGNIRQRPSDNQEVFEDTNWNIYRGVYLPQSKKLLEWGLKKNMIRPQDPKEIGNAEFSYSFYMYQNYKMRNLAVPEKIEQPVNGMILSVLKIEQVIAKSRPPGAMINTRALQAIDYGLGDKKNKEIDQKKLFDQTGDLYYYDLDADGKPIPIPISEIPNAGFQVAITGHIQSYQFYYQQLRDQLGEDPNLISQALQPRVTAQNVNTSERAAENSTDYMYDGFLYVLEDTSNKVTCLLQKSVLFGAKAYRHILKEPDVQDRIFSATAKMLPTEQEIAMLDARMNALIQASPEAAMYIDTFKILRIAKENIKLAEEYYRQCMKKMLQTQQAQTQQNQDATFKAQFAAAKQKGAMDLENLKKKLELEGDAAKEASKNKMKEIALQGAFQVMSSKEGDVKPEWTPVINELIQNIMLPLLAQNIQHTAALGQAIGAPPPEQQGEQESQQEDMGDTQPEQQPQIPQQQPQAA
ncbi:MAG TPA: hypothetical protein VIM07_00800 [Chitinophagaceae bacterium]